MSQLLDNEHLMTTLAARLKLSPARLSELLANNETRKSWGPPHVHQAVGLSKTPHLVRALLQCRELAATLEARLLGQRTLGPALSMLATRLTALALAYQQGGTIPELSAPTVLLAELASKQAQAMELEAQTNSQSHLSHTLEHVQAQLVLLVFDVEQ